MSNNIVIVGGGFAGTQLANALEKSLAKSNDTKHRIILIEKVTKSLSIFLKLTAISRKLTFIMQLVVFVLLLLIGMNVS